MESNIFSCTECVLLLNWDPQLSTCRKLKLIRLFCKVKSWIGHTSQWTAECHYDLLFWNCLPKDNKAHSGFLADFQEEQSRWTLITHRNIFHLIMQAFKKQCLKEPGNSPGYWLTLPLEIAWLAYQCTGKTFVFSVINNLIRELLSNTEVQILCSLGSTLACPVPNVLTKYEILLYIQPCSVQQGMPKYVQWRLK